ncbi:glycosyltransferase [Nitrospira sp. T9]|uniref:glycosyltransferase n=1 Tax=unclassified Nitrospira TaxID=2652172 RepID=UPI003F99285B
MKTSAPIFSIVIPTYNRPKQLAACLQACTRLDYPHDRFEIIIVDDGSPVPVEVLRDGGSNLPSIICLRQINTGPASARNMGAQHARGDILAFTDDDCVPNQQWLRELAQSFNDVPTGLVGGRTVNGLFDNIYSTVSQMIVDEAYAFFLSCDSDLRFFASNNMAVATRHFHKIGGFDSSFRTSEDREFCDRWIRQGHTLVYTTKAIVHHYHQLTLTAFCRQHFSYGRGAYQFHRTRARCALSLLKPDPRFYASVFRRALSGKKPLRMTGLVILWQMANLAGFLWQAAHHAPVSTKSASRE